MATQELAPDWSGFLTAENAAAVSERLRTLLGLAEGESVDFKPEACSGSALRVEFRWPLAEFTRLNPDGRGRTTVVNLERVGRALAAERVRREREVAITVDLDHLELAAWTLRECMPFELRDAFARLLVAGGP